MALGSSCRMMVILRQRREQRTKMVNQILVTSLQREKILKMLSQHSKKMKITALK
jgi:hypothetical protein